MKKYSVVLAMCALLISCKKEDVSFNALDFLDSKQAVAQTFTVQAGQPINITSAKGFNLIHDGVFSNGSGQPITGDVIISLKEVTKKSEAIYNRLLTEDEAGSILKSAGMLTLAFRQNNNLVYPENPVQVIIPSNGSPDTTMRLYNQGVQNFQPGDTNRYSVMPWADGGEFLDSCSSLSFTANSYNLLYCFTWFPSPLRWINLDVPLYPLPATTVQTMVNSDIQDAMVYIIFDNYNSVAEFHGYMEPNRYSINNVPVGESVKIIVIGNSGEEAVFGKYSGVVTEDMVANINVNPITQEELEAELSAID